MSQDRSFIWKNHWKRLDGAGPQGITRAGQRVWAMLMDSQMWHLPAGSVALWVEDSEKGQWPLPTVLSGGKLSLSSHLHARHFSSSLYAAGTFQAATPVLELRGSVSE